ncbi:MAG: glycosyltransferase family 2 protein, partial [Chloroflexia bacterium]
MVSVSVVIPNYNGLEHLPACLESLRAQRFRDFETILVDDGSADGSAEWVRRHHPEVRVLELPRNMGMAAAANRGWRLAAGREIALLNNDTRADPGWLEALVEAAETHPEIPCFASKIRLFDRPGVLHAAGDLYGVDGIPRNRGAWEEDHGQYDEALEVWGPCGAAACYRRVLLEELGGFDERLFMYLEDVDLAWRAQLRGYRCRFVPQAIVYHKVSATGGGALASYYVGRNTLLVLAKDMPGPLLRRHWGAIVRAQMRIATEALRHWRGAAARARLRGQLAGLLLLPAWWPARRRVQAGRTVSLEELAGR